MIEYNFTVSDIFSTLCGFVLFPLVIVIPGYVVCCFLNVLSFRNIRFYHQIALSILISFVVSPIVFYLLSIFGGYRLVSFFVFLLLLGAILLFVRNVPSVSFSLEEKCLLLCALVWIVFSLLSLVDIQLRNGLYYSVTSGDHTTRISVVDAMKRTGVPPVNPSYYPGKPVTLSFLYFFWYILGGFIDFIGGNLVDARGAFFASIIWAGLGLMAAISFYLYFRNTQLKSKLKSSLFWGIALLTVTGLDIFPVILVISNLHSPIPDAEQWNEQISSWLSSLLWVPHHVAALVAGIAILLLLNVANDQSKKMYFSYMTLCGFAFASMFGLSVWVTFVFVLFWLFLLFQMILKKHNKEYIVLTLYAGILALCLSVSFLRGITSTAGSNLQGVTVATLPINFAVRHFSLLDALIEGNSDVFQSLLRLLFLPLNYFLELGFYFVAGLIWLRARKDQADLTIFSLEKILLLSSLLIATFLRSTIIENNDLGWRSWLPGQFVLLIWGVDVISIIWKKLSIRTQVNLAFLMIIGLFSTLINVSLLRFQPIFIDVDNNLGRHNLSARKAYTSIITTFSENVIVQYNPDGRIDRPSGLYGMRQSAISDRTAYGIPSLTFLEKVNDVKRLFNLQNIKSWQPVDDFCKKFFIDVLVIEDKDPLWGELDILAKERKPYFLDNNYAVFSCGNFAFSKSH